MFATLTFTADLFAMAASLWLAFYLFARGYPSRVTIRTTLVLLALSMYFLGAYNNYFQQTPGTATLRAVLLVIGMACWYSTTFHLLPEHQQTRLRWMETGIYLLSFATIIFLIANPDSFSSEEKTSLYAAPMQFGWTFFFYGSAIFWIHLLLPFNLWINHRARLSAQGRLLFLGSFIPLVMTIYRMISYLTDVAPTPRLVQDLFIFSGVFLLGISVARYQSMLERRTILEEFPLTAAIVLSMALLYGLIGVLGAFPISALGNVTASLIVTIGLYDLGREALDRRRTLGRSRFRKQLRTLENDGNNQDKLQRLLQEGLDLLCDTLHAVGGMVAVCNAGKTVVMATRNSAPVGSELATESAALNEELWRSNGEIQNVEWMFSIFEGQKQIVLAGLGPSETKLQYSSGDLELFAEFADHAGTIVSIGNLLPITDLSIHELIEESQAQSAQLSSAAEEMLNTLSGPLEGDLVKMVEDALRNFSDFMVLGQSPLANWMGVDEETYIERGKQLHRILREAVDTLRPAGTRPIDPIPRSWYSYVVLHDAYLEGAPNRDVMARLYISEATFHRTRRRALRGLARGVVDKFGERQRTAN
jgi:hypothetical protein